MDLIMFGIIVFLAIVLIGKLFKAQLKLAFKLLLNALLGLVTLFAVNYIGSNFGFTLPISWVSCIIAGVFGLPGVALLYVIQWAGLI